MKSQIEMNRIENQDEIDNDYSRCKVCGNILHDLYCGTQVCPCRIDNSVLHHWSVSGSALSSLDDSEFIDNRPIDYKALDKIAGKYFQFVGDNEAEISKLGRGRIF